VVKLVVKRGQTYQLYTVYKAYWRLVKEKTRREVNGSSSVGGARSESIATKPFHGERYLEKKLIKNIIYLIKREMNWNYLMKKTKLFLQFLRDDFKWFSKFCILNGSDRPISDWLRNNYLKLIKAQYRYPLHMNGERGKIKVLVR